MKSRNTIRPWTLRGLSLLAGFCAVTGLSVSAAHAAGCSDEEQAAYDAFEALAEVMEDLDDEFDTDPDAKDCEKICKTMLQACEQASKDVTKAAQTVNKSVDKASQTLCGSTELTKECKQEVKEQSKDMKDDLKETKNDYSEVCSDEDLAQACSDACNDGVYPESCEGVFYGDI